VIEIRQKIYRTKKLPDCALLSALKKFSKGLVNCVLLGSKATNLPGLVEKAIVNLEICGHLHTVRHTLHVSRETQAASQFENRQTEQGLGPRYPQLAQKPRSRMVRHGSPFPHDAHSQGPTLQEHGSLEANPACMTKMMGCFSPISLLESEVPTFPEPPGVLVSR